MDMWDVFDTVKKKALTDMEFRARLLLDAREAIFDATGEMIPIQLKVTIHESNYGDMCFILPYKPSVSSSVELSDDEMDQIAGGGKEDTIMTLQVQYGHFDKDGNVVIDSTETYDKPTEVRV